MAHEDVKKECARRDFREASEVLKGFDVMRGGMKNRRDMVKLYDAKSYERDAAAKRAGL